MTRVVLIWILLLSSVVLAAQESPPPQAGQTVDLYRLTPGDVIEIRFFFNPELNEQGIQIRPDGRISLQLIGEVTLGGLTVEEARAAVEKLALKEIASPRVTIQVRNFAALKVFVTGEVIRPGPIDLPGQMTLLEAIGQVGGRRPTADSKTVILIRKGGTGQPEGRRLSPYQGDREGPDAAVMLRPFDVVVVPESKITRLDRWVDQHIRQLSPAILSAGFTYLIQNHPGNVVPIF
jgi:protein involved in polysaccharide export with SLBB domain